MIVRLSCLLEKPELLTAPEAWFVKRLLNELQTGIPRRVKVSEEKVVKRIEDRLRRKKLAAEMPWTARGYK